MRNRVKLARRLALVSAAGVAVALMIPLAPAVAAVAGLMVSTDGVNFSPGRSLSMFEDVEKIVPGDHVADSVWVRNDASIAARLRIDVTQPDSDSQELAGGLTLTVARQGVLLSEPLSLDRSIQNGACTVLATGIVLQPGESARLDFELAITSLLDHRAGVKSTSHFAVTGVLEDASVPDRSSPGGICVKPDTGGGGNEPTFPLTRTGAASPLWLVVVAALGIGGGVLFGMRAHRRARAGVDSSGSSAALDAPEAAS